MKDAAPGADRPVLGVRDFRPGQDAVNTGSWVTKVTVWRSLRRVRKTDQCCSLMAC